MKSLSTDAAEKPRSAEAAAIAAAVAARGPLPGMQDAPLPMVAAQLSASREERPEADGPTGAAGRGRGCRGHASGTLRPAASSVARRAASRSSRRRGEPPSLARALEWDSPCSGAAGGAAAMALVVAIACPKPVVAMGPASVGLGSGSDARRRFRPPRWSGGGRRSRGGGAGHHGNHRPCGPAAASWVPTVRRGRLPRAPCQAFRTCSTPRPCASAGAIVRLKALSGRAGECRRVARLPLAAAASPAGPPRPRRSSRAPSAIGISRPPFSTTAARAPRPRPRQSRRRPKSHARAQGIGVWKR